MEIYWKICVFWEPSPRQVDPMRARIMGGAWAQYMYRYTQQLNS